MTTFAQQLMTDILMAQGVDKTTAELAVRVVLGAAVAVELITEPRLATWERDARIYDLRGQKLTCPMLSARFRLHPVQVFKIVRRHAKRRRAAMRLVS